MSTATQERIDERERAIARLKPLLASVRPLYTLTTYTRSETDYVRVFVVEDGRIAEITYFAARVLERRLSDKGIPMKGGGYSKALDVADSLHRRLYGGKPINQQLWSEL